MDSNEEATDSPNRDALNVDVLQDLEGIKVTAALDSINRVTPRASSQKDAAENLSINYPILLKTRSSSQGLKEFSISATQTPLTLTKLCVIKPPADKNSIDSTTSPTAPQNVGITELSFSLNNVSTNQKPTCDTKKSCEFAKPPPCTSDLNEMSIKYSREATTQATPPHPSLIRAIPTTPRDTLQISTSLSSSKSGPKSEVLTLTTDYGNQSPDARSILVDAIDQNGNRGLHVSVQGAFGLPRVLDLPQPNRDSLRNDLSTHRTNRQWWRLYNCLRCTSASDRRSRIRDAPPTYSTIYANRTPTLGDWRPFHSANQSSFVAPIPPPSYAQAQGACLPSYSMDHLHSVTPSTAGSWSPRPTTVICPRCMTIIITTIEVRQSTITHVTALILFLCGCWPCCMLPYCMNSCKSIDHYCPICRTYLGTYRPW